MDAPRQDGAGGYRGQKQIWFLLRMVGRDCDVRLRASGHPEFDAWRWHDYWVPLEAVIDFKRDVYARRCANCTATCSRPRAAGGARGARRASRHRRINRRHWFFDLINRGGWLRLDPCSGSPHDQARQPAALETTPRNAALSARASSSTRNCAPCTSRAPHLQFEDELLIRYQVQGDAARRAHLRGGGHPGRARRYNPLLPDGGNWKATLFIEYPEVESGGACSSG